MFGMSANDLNTIFDTVYRTELVYESACWKRCGDAHCCNFSRYKQRFSLIAKTPFQELPLLPGEYEYLCAKGWDQQFAPFEHRVIVFPMAGRDIRMESIVSQRPGCACDHATRPTICRLYPLLPRFDMEGHLCDTEPLGIYEEMERIGGLASACQLESLPFSQLGPFLAVTSALARSPWLRFHLEAYRLTKQHVAARIADRVAATGRDVFSTFEIGFLRHTLIDAELLRSALEPLAAAFDKRYPGWDRVAAMGPIEPNQRIGTR
jgi:hypothetical protein